MPSSKATCLSAWCSTCGPSVCSSVPASPLAEYPHSHHTGCYPRGGLDVFARQSQGGPQCKHLTTPSRTIIPTRLCTTSKPKFRVRLTSVNCQLGVRQWRSTMERNRLQRVHGWHSGECHLCRRSHALRSLQIRLFNVVHSVPHCCLDRLGMPSKLASAPYYGNRSLMIPEQVYTCFLSWRNVKLIEYSYESVKRHNSASHFLPLHDPDALTGIYGP